jgi:hypothetical protein
MSCSTQRAKKHFNFLKSELPHCEDMLQYLEGGENGAEPHTIFENNEITIDVTNYKIRMARCLNQESLTQKMHGEVTHTIDMDPLQGSVFEKRRNSKSVGGARQSLNKPRFAKMMPVDCFDIEETEELDSSFLSSNCEHPDFSQEASQKSKNTCELRNSGYRVKSPEYCKRSAAETKVKNSILN